MSNKNINSMNSSDKKIKTKKDSYNKNSVNDLLQRIASGQSGVVLEVLFWIIMAERKFGLSLKKKDQTMKIKSMTDVCFEYKARCTN